MLMLACKGNKLFRNRSYLPYSYFKMQKKRNGSWAKKPHTYNPRANALKPD